MRIHGQGIAHDASDSEVKGVPELVGELSDVASDLSTRVPSGAIPHALFRVGL